MKFDCTSASRPEPAVLTPDSGVPNLWLSASASAHNSLSVDGSTPPRREGSESISGIELYNDIWISTSRLCCTVHNVRPPLDRSYYLCKGGFMRCRLAGNATMHGQCVGHMSVTPALGRHSPLLTIAMPTNTQFPRIAIVDIPGKGKGVVAKQYIPPGALIISEKPRIILPADNSGMVDRQGFARIFQALATLSQDDSEFFMSFPCALSENPIPGRLKHFTPCFGDNAFGLCLTISRVNHTCYSPKSGPNASYCWNSRTKEEDLRAIREIHEGQEVEVSYMSDITNYESPPAYLRREFGFECCCKGCTRPPAERLASDQRILAYNAFVLQVHSRFGRESPLQILKDLETQILLLCEEGYIFEVAGRADDAFELCASYGDAASARQWEEICRDRYAIHLGTDSENWETAQRLAARPQDWVGWQKLGRRNLKGPSARILAYCSRNGETARGASPELPISTAVTESVASGIEPSLDVPTASAAVKLSKGQKKKAKAKARKQAEQNPDKTNVTI